MKEIATAPINTEPARNKERIYICRCICMYTDA